MAIFEKESIVSISHVGESALITNAGMLSILEDIACKHSDVVGYGLKDISTTHLSWVLLSWKVNILRRAIYGEKLTIKTWAKPSGKFNTYRDFEVFDENGEKICIATTKWTLINTQTGTITKITDDIINCYNPEIINVFENPNIEKLLEPTDFSSTCIYQTQRRDIDVNKHMHNLNYLYLAYEALPQNVFEAIEYNNIEIMYKKGIKLGDTVKCLYSYDNTNKEHYVTIKSEDEKNLHCIVKLYN